MGPVKGMHDPTVNNPKCYPCVDYGKHLQRGGGVSTATTIDLTSTNLDLDPDGEGIKGTTAQPSHYTVVWNDAHALPIEALSEQFRQT